MKPKILITSKATDTKASDYKNYISAVENSGGEPKLGGILSDTAEAYALVQKFDGLILSGGGDVDPERYGQTPHEKTDGVNRDLDETELALIKAFRKQNKPILAICRGIQILHVALGGKLIQHIPDVDDTQKHNNKEIRHPITVTGGILGGIYSVGTTLSVNSTHHQAASDLVEGETLCAMSDDKIIESFSVGDNILAVQFHPEKLYEELEPLWMWYINICGADRVN